MEDIEHIEKEMKLINSDGRRLDGRSFDELRPIRIEAGGFRRGGGSPAIARGGEEGGDAGVPMRDLVTSCASGKIDDVVCLDLNKDEDNFGDADCPMAIVPRTGDVVLLQMDGHLTYDEFQKAMGLSIDATERIYEMQRDALRRRYSVTLEDILKESPPAAAPAEPEPEQPPEDDFGPEGI